MADSMIERLKQLLSDTPGTGGGWTTTTTGPTLGTGGGKAYEPADYVPPSVSGAASARAHTPTTPPPKPIGEPKGAKYVGSVKPKKATRKQKAILKAIRKPPKRM